MTPEWKNGLRLTKAEAEWLDWAEGGTDTPEDLDDLLELLEGQAPDLIDDEYDLGTIAGRNRLRVVESLTRKLLRDSS